VEETRALLGQLERVQRLDRAHAEPAEIVAELRELLASAEEWARTEGGETGAHAVGELRSALARHPVT
jgi:hypothetical protein